MLTRERIFEIGCSVGFGPTTKEIHELCDLALRGLDIIPATPDLKAAREALEFYASIKQLGTWSTDPEGAEEQELGAKARAVLRILDEAKP